jgi:hypothetical protein
MKIVRTLLVAVPLVALGACTAELSQADRDLLNAASTNAQQAKDTAQQALTAAQAAQASSKEAAQSAQAANEKADRMFQRSLRKTSSAK